MMNNNTTYDMIQPYSLNVKDAAMYFGFAKHTLYQWINDGKLIRGRHYLKVGNKILIIREGFMDFLKEKNNGCREQG